MSEVLANTQYNDDLDELYRLIDDGRLGLNIGISTGLPKLDSTIAGVQRQTMYLIAGDTGSGKTSFCLYSLIYKPLRERLGDPTLRFVYYSLEMSKEMLLTKLLSIYLYEEYGVQLSYNQILSRSEILQDEHYLKVKEARSWLAKAMEHITVFDKRLSSSRLYAHLKEYSESNGSYIENASGTSTTYVPNVKNQYVIVILDHIWLLSTLTGQTKKDAADTAADYLIWFRNKCGYTPVILQQLNRQAGSMDRRNAELQMPELQDLKGSAGPSEAADVVLALFNPFRQKVPVWNGYKIGELRDKFRAITVMKSRFGEVEVAVPVNFFGNVNIFIEMPKSEEIKDYRIYKNIDFRYEEASNEEEQTRDKTSFSGITINDGPDPVSTTGFGSFSISPPANPDSVVI